MEKDYLKNYPDNSMNKLASKYLNAINEKQQQIIDIEITKKEKEKKDKLEITKQEKEKKEREVKEIMLERYNKEVGAEYIMETCFLPINRRVVPKASEDELKKVITKSINEYVPEGKPSNSNKLLDRISTMLDGDIEGEDTFDVYNEYNEEFNKII